MKTHKQCKEEEQSLVDDILFLPDWNERFEYIADYANQLKPLPEEYRTDENLVKGCQSRVWLSAKKQGNSIEYFADADAAMPRGVVAMLLHTIDGAPADVAASYTFELPEKTGLLENLSPNRVSGLKGMMAKINDLAK